MTTYYTIRERSGKVAGQANTLAGAQRAKQTLERKTGVELRVYGPEHQTFQRALEILR